MSDYYSTLGVDRKTSADDIKKAYRQLALKYHPDRNKDNPAVEEKFKNLSEAYAVLSDEKKRREYDNYGQEGFNQRFSQEEVFRDFDFASTFQQFGGGFSGNNPFSGLEDYFSRRRGGGAGGNSFYTTRGGDLKQDLQISFEEAALGAKKIVAINRRGTREETSFRVPAGIENGKTIRLGGKGLPSPVPNGQPGDLMLRVQIQPHPVFKRDGYNIVMEKEISLFEALLGTSMSIPTLNGEIMMKIPAGTQSHSKLRLKNKGIPKKKANTFGDQLVQIIIKIPKELNEEQTNLVQQLKESGL